MAQAYTRQSSFADGDTITAALFNNEYNQLVNAFAYSSSNASTTGHRHDGTAGQGGNIPQIGDLDFLNKIVVDSTNNRWGIFVEVSGSAVEQIRFQDGALLPVTDSDVDLGTSSLYFKDAYIDSITTTGNVAVGGNLTVTGTTTFNGGTITMGDAATDNVVFGADVDSNIIPDDDNTYDLGSSSQEWKDLYVDGIAYLDGINFNGTAITATAAELNILDGVTATATELNILDGVTSTTAELNILDGVTASATDINLIDGITNGTVIASKAIITDSNKDITGGRNITISGQLAAATLDISGDVDVDGTLEADAITVNGTTLAETISDTVGAMVTSNTETGVTVTYDDSDNTLDFVIGTLNQDTTGNAATATALETARTIHGVSFDGTANIDLTEVVQDTVGAMFSSNTESGITVAYQDSDGTIDLTVGTLNQDTTGNAATATTLETARTIGGVSFDGSANINLPGVNTAGNQNTSGNAATATLATTTTVTDSTANTNFPVVFHDESNGLLDDTGALRYNPSTGELLVPKLTVAGTTTQVDTVTMNASNAIVFEGATADANETTLSIVDPTSDHTQYLINQGGYIPVLAAATTTAITSTPAELNLLDGSTANTVVNSKAVIYGSSGELAGTLSTAAQPNITSLGTLTTLTVDDITINGSTISDSGDLTLDVGGDIVLDADGANIQFKNGGVEFGQILTNATPNDFIIRSSVSDEDMVFQGNDNGTIFAALTLDMSDAGTATFNHDIKLGDNGKAIFGAGDDLEIYSDGGSNNYIISNNGALILRNLSDDKDIYLQSNDGSGGFTSYLHAKGSSGEVILKHYGSNKLATTSSGIDVTGTINGVGISSNITNFSNSILISQDASTGTLSSASDNTGLGTSVFDDLTSGTRNTAVGSGAFDVLTTGAQNVAIGRAAGGSLTTGDDSVFLGERAGSSTTTASDNTGVGQAALLSNTTGANNTALGSGTLQENTTASNNTAVGFEALNDNTTGHSNTAVGALALDANTTANENTAVGYSSLGANTTGTRNTSVGFQCGLVNTTGNDNVVVGHNSLSANTTGSQNTSIGRGSLNANTTADNNTAVGYYALLSNTTGTGNTAVGALSLDANTTASYNTAIGNQAMGSNVDGSRNTAVGYAALFTMDPDSAADTYNTAVGFESLKLNTTGTNNTAVGALSLDANTTGENNASLGASSLGANTTGSSNTALGMNALRDNTTADNNTAVGLNALLATTTGSSNTAIGVEALKDNSTGTNNVAVGENALANNTTAGENTAVGQNALLTNTTGGNLIAVGHDSLRLNTTGSNNIGIGVDALRSTTTGAANIGIGTDALKSHTTASNNTAVGHQALTANTTANANTAVGKRALASNTTGTNNVAVGTDALENHTTGSDNVAIGKNVANALTTGNTNIAIGGQAMNTNTVGDRNVAIGYSALETYNPSSNEDSYNVAVGFAALEANTTAKNNTAIGGNALLVNTTGSSNVAVGIGTLDACTTGGSNTAVGALAGTSLTTGVLNTLVGDDAGDSVTTGDSNTHIGASAGAEITSGSGNICIGKDSGTTGSPTGGLTGENNIICLGDENITAAHIQVSFTVASDKRDKTDVEPIKMGLDFVNKLEPVTYKWDKRSLYVEKGEDFVDIEPDGTHKEDWLDVGFLAQDVEKLESEYGYNIADKTNLTTTLTGDGNQYGLTYEKFIPMLVKSIQELSAEVEKLKKDSHEPKGLKDMDGYNELIAKINNLKGE